MNNNINKNQIEINKYSNMLYENKNLININEENNKILPDFYFKLYNDLDERTKNELFTLFTRYLREKNDYNLIELGRKLEKVEEISIFKNNLNRIHVSNIDNIHSEFWGSKYTHTTLRKIKYNNGQSKIYKFIVDKKKKIQLLIAKTFIEFIIQSILNYIYLKYVPEVNYLAFYKTNSTNKLLNKPNIENTLGTEKLYIVMDYVEGITLNIFLKKELIKINDIKEREKIIIEILMYISDIIYTYQIRCNFVHGDLNLNNILISYFEKNNGIKINYIKIIDFGSSSLNVKIDNIDYLIYDNSKKTTKLYLNTINYKAFSLSGDLLYLLIQILFDKEIEESNLMSNNFKNKIKKLFNINYRDNEDLVNRYRFIATKFYRENREYKEKNLNKKKELIQKNINYYVGYNPLKFMCKIKNFRINMFGDKNYDLFYPFNFNLKLFNSFYNISGSNLINNINIIYSYNNNYLLNKNNKNNNDINNVNDNIFNYLKDYGLYNIIGLTIFQKIDLLKFIFRLLYVNDNNIDKKCEIMDEINNYLMQYMSSRYNINKNVSIARGSKGSVDYLSIENRVIKKLIKTDISEYRVHQDSISTKLIEYIIGSYIKSINIPKIYCSYLTVSNIDILLEKVNGITLSQYFNNINRINYNNGYNNFDKIIINILLDISIILNDLQHRYNFIHRDLHLNNIFINDKGEIVLIDFGTSSIYLKTPFGNRMITNFYKIKRHDELIVDGESLLGKSSDILHLIYNIIYRYRYNNTKTKYLSNKMTKLIEEYFFNGTDYFNENYVKNIRNKMNNNRQKNLLLLFSSKYKTYRKLLYNNKTNMLSENFIPYNAIKIFKKIINEIDETNKRNKTNENK